MIQIINGQSYANIYTCGDLHGEYSLLMHELKKINFNFETDLLIGTGDLVDRGLENQKCVELLDQKWFKTIRGNHEDFCIEGNKDPEMARVHASNNNGGSWFYLLNETIRNSIVERFNQLPYLIELQFDNQKIGFAHADVPMDDWEELKKFVTEGYYLSNRSLTDWIVWSRKLVYQPVCYPPILNIDKVYLGHTVLPKVKQVGNCFFIDTGAVFTKHLTIVKIK